MCKVAIATWLMQVSSGYVEIFIDLLLKTRTKNLCKSNICCQGTTTDQDNRFSDKEKKLLKTMKFEDVLAKKVDMGKVKVDVLKPWITKRVYELLKVEDDVGPGEKKTARKAKIDVEGERKEARITSGAEIIIKNVLPYLKME